MCVLLMLLEAWAGYARGWGICTDTMLHVSSGRAGQVYEHVLGEEKYTFVEDVQNPHSCTILIKVGMHNGLWVVPFCCSPWLVTLAAFSTPNVSPLPPT